MDLTKFLGQDSQEQSAQRLSKEEYAAQKKQEREEITGLLAACLKDLRIDQHDRALTYIDDNDTFQDSYLRSCKPYATCIIHGFKHVIN